MSIAAGGRARRPRSVRATLATIVLGLELVVVALAALVLFGLAIFDPRWLALAGGVVLIALIVAAIALSRSQLGIGLGWAVQVILVLCMGFDFAVGLVGLIFGGMWIYCMIVGGRIDRREAGSTGAR